MLIIYANWPLLQNLGYTDSEPLLGGYSYIYIYIYVYIDISWHNSPHPEQGGMDRIYEPGQRRISNNKNGH